MSLIDFVKENKDYLELFNKLTDDETSTRSNTVNTIIKHVNDQQAKIKDDIDFATNSLIKYTLQRLIRGLTSTKHIDRIAFANAFSQV